MPPSVRACVDVYNGMTTTVTLQAPTQSDRRMEIHTAPVSQNGTGIESHKYKGVTQYLLELWTEIEAFQLSNKIIFCLRQNND